MSDRLIAGNILEGSKSTCDVYGTGSGTVYLEFKRGAQKFGCELNVDQAQQLSAALRQAALREQTLLLKRLGDHVGAM